jgi:predicted dehydrogenase
LKALVIGYGSIGSRHARVLSDLGCNTAVLSRRRVDFPLVFHDIKSALVEHQPEYLVVANPTNQHHETLEALATADYTGRVLVEKPLFQAFKRVPKNGFRSLSVAYNLRFHPLIQRLHDMLLNETVLSVQAYVGQHLPDWRPGTDYRSSYSAQAAQGGGALRDLSHELDYLGWLCGAWSAVTALGGHVSSLEIDSDDLFVLLMQTERCPAVSVQVSYLDRVARRRLTINTQRHAIEADLVAGLLSIDGKAEPFVVERDRTYREMHRAALSGDLTALCTVEEGLTTLQLIEAAERANRQKEWIRR